MSAGYLILVAKDFSCIILIKSRAVSESLPSVFWNPHSRVASATRGCVVGGLSSRQDCRGTRYFSYFFARISLGPFINLSIFISIYINTNIYKQMVLYYYLVLAQKGSNPFWRYKYGEAFFYSNNTCLIFGSIML